MDEQIKLTPLQQQLFAAANKLQHAAALITSAANDLTKAAEGLAQAKV